MKKTAVAIATLAATGVFAQVTITGEVAYGYQASSNPSTSNLSQTDQVRAALGYAMLSGKGGSPVGDSSGFGVDTSAITVKSEEDLGGGYKATAAIGFDGVTRTGANGGDVSLSLLTPVGLISMQTYKPDDYLTGLWNVAGAGTGLDGRVWGDRDYKDAIGFTTKVGPVYVGVSQYEAGNAAGSTTANLLGIGVGASGSPSTVQQRINSLSVTYVANTLKANFNYLSYDNRTDGVDTSRKDVLRVGATYGMGDLKLGGAYSYTTLMSGATLSETTASAAYTLGALTLGAVVGQGTLNGTKAGAWVTSALQTLGYTAVQAGALSNAVANANGVLDGTRTGYGLNATYALSKRTALIASYRNWTSSPWTTDRSAQTWMVLDHTF